MKAETFDYFLDNIEELRIQYKEFLTPFFNAKMVRCWKKMIYSLPMKLELRDYLWEALNGDIDIEKNEKGELIIESRDIDDL